MNYNKFSYYRNNPYYDNGNMPPIAMLNRKQRDFVGQMPMGQQHLQPIGRKQFVSLHHRSSIQQQNILSSPERYPYENRIAMDKSYLRNLNTIDIEGAKSGTVVSEAVRNRMKAQLELQRQRIQRNSQAQSKIQNFMRIEQIQKRQIAQKQYQRNKELQYLNMDIKNGLKRNSHENLNHTIDIQSQARKREVGDKQAVSDRNRQFSNKGYIKHNYHNPEGSNKRSRKSEVQQNNTIENIYEKQKYTFVNPLKEMEKQKEKQKERAHRYSQKVDQMKQLTTQKSTSQVQTDFIQTVDKQREHIQDRQSQGDASPLLRNYQMKRSSQLRKDNPTYLSSLNQSYSLSGKSSLGYY